MSNPLHSEKLQTVIDAVRHGGKIAFSYYNQELEIKIKDDKTIVTKADEEVELVIKKHISSKFPQSKFVGEETGGSTDGDEFWIIDPIDGTRSFVRGLPTWCVMVALYTKKDIQLAACYFPIFDSIVYAEKGEGAYCDDKKVAVSRIAHLKDAWTAPSHVKHFENKKGIIDLLTISANVRMMGNYSLYLIACGKMEAFVDPYLKLWDIAPWKVIIEEAGGKVTRINGDAWDLKGNGGILTNGHVHDEVVQTVNQ